MRWQAFHYKTRETLHLFRVNDHIRIQSGPDLSTTPPPDRSRFILTPGLVDLQINGFAGVDFNRVDGGIEEDVIRVVEAQHSIGVSHIVPTVTTHSFEHMNTVLANLTRARNNPLIRRAVPALHLEGPYFSPEDGPRGAHPKNYVRPPDRDEFQRWQETAEGMIRIVTLSPHYDEAPAFIRHLVDDGVAVAIGHTSATPEQIRAAVDAGASLSTHLGNGAHAFLPRHPNYLWEQLAADELSATLIVDGHHLSPSVVRCMVRSKSPDRVILISDAVSVAGLKSGRYRTLNMDVQLTDDGAVRLAGTPFLAGAALKLPRAVMNVHNFARVSFPAAVDMASRHPARFLTEHAGVFLSTDLVIPRKDAPMTGSFTLFKKSDDDLRAVLTVVDGSVVYERP